MRVTPVLLIRPRCQVWRYYLLSVRPEQSDTDFKWSDLQVRAPRQAMGERVGWTFDER